MPDSPPTDTVPAVLTTGEVKVRADCFALNAIQSAALKTPLFNAEAVGTFKVMTGVVVPLATEEDRSVPVVPRVKAATFVTVPSPAGRSAETSARNVGPAAPPAVGPAKTVFAD